MKPLARPWRGVALALALATTDAAPPPTPHSRADAAMVARSLWPSAAANSSMVASSLEALTAHAPGPSQVNIWRRLSSRLRLESGGEQAAVQITTIGGSMAAGSQCLGSLSFFPQRDCAYTAAFAKALRLTYPTTPIKVANLAQGGTTTAGVLPSLATLLTGGGGGGGASLLAPDLLLVDFSANDEFERQDWSEGRSSFGQASERDKSRAVAAATEALLRYVATALPTTAVVPSATPPTRMST